MSRLPIYEFIRERLVEYDPKFEVREGTGFFELFIKPLQFILQPYTEEVLLIRTDQSFLRILETGSPDDYDEESVDNLASNVFVDRIAGDFSGGVARVYYNSALSREWPANGIIIYGSNGQVYTNPSPFATTEIEMRRSMEDGLYYYDIPIISTEVGEDTELEANQLVSVDNDPDVVLIRNPDKIEGGRDRESNTALIARAKQSIAVRDLVTGKGFNATIFENFGSFITEVHAIGFGDSEMMRDILFNIHIGGYVDGYLKTLRITTSSKDFIGVGRDATRQVKSGKNVQLMDTDTASLGYPYIDRANGRDPVVRQVKPKEAAEYISTVDMTDPVDLSVNQYVGLVIDGVELTIRVAGAIPSTTSRNEIVNKINSVFGVDVAEPLGTTFKIKSLQPGLDSVITIKDPATGTSALLEVFGLTPGSEYNYYGDGPLVFTEGIHYEIDDEDGTIKRVIGPIVLGSQVNGETAEDSEIFADHSIATIFDAVTINDILTIESGDDAGDYRILEVNTEELTLDKALTTSATGISYTIRRTGIKNEELLYVEYYFNPISIDIGKYVIIDESTRERGVRPGRDDWTITDVPFLRVVSINLIDPISGAELGTALQPSKGWGGGIYGAGPYGIGNTGDYRFIVNKPHERFSVFEDSLLVLNTRWRGYSIRVTYETVTELEPIHDFVRSYSERTLGSDILIKHFLPAYVSGTIEYKVDPSNTSAPTNADLQQQVIDFITSFPVGSSIQYSDIIQFIVRKTDPTDRYGGFVNPFTLKAKIYNTDGSLTIITGTSGLTIPTLDPFPLDTTRPLSPNIVHWIGDQITLVRL